MDEHEQELTFLYRDRARQLIDLKGLRLGENMWPTDIDGVIEWKDRAYVWLEFKYEDAPMPDGQRICLERLVKDAQAIGKGAIALLIRHHTRDTQEDVDAAECEVSEIFFAGQWRQAKAGQTTKDVVEQFLSEYGYEKEKPEWTTNR